MSIFDSLFGHKKEEQKEDKVNLTKQIDTLVLVIENLGLLNKEKIIEKLDKLPVEYDKNLIKRLSIMFSVEIEILFPQSIPSREIDKLLSVAALILIESNLTSNDDWNQA